MSGLVIRWRKARNWLRAYSKWVQQGRPDYMPTVIREGTITKCRHGYASVEWWHWDSRFQLRPVDLEHMVDILGAQYGVTRVKELDSCPACQSVVTA